MSRVNIYNIKGEKAGTALLPPEIFDVEMKADLVHQAATTQMANRRQMVAHVKDRSEARGGGVKPWRQKGTGRARHGSIRSPLWVGGGVTFGPNRERVLGKKINKKMKRKALFMVLTSKVKDNELILLDTLEIKEPKTKIMAEVFKNLFKEDTKTKQQPSVLVVIPAKDEKTIRASRNIPRTKIIRADNLNVLDLLSFKYLLMPKEAIKVIEKTYGTAE